MTRTLTCTMLVMLAGCDQLLGLDHVTPIDGSVDNGGLVAYYPMDVVGTSLSECAADAIGKHVGACVPSIPALVPGKLGMAYAFDGSTSLRIPGAIDLDDTTGLTVAAWFEVSEATGDTQCLVNRVLGTAADNSWQICVAPTFFYAAGGYFYGATTFPLGTWHHVAITWSQATGAMQGWVDGLTIGSANAPQLVYDGNPMMFGTDLDNGVPASKFIGALDEVRIYNRELGALELLALASQ